MLVCRAEKPVRGFGGGKIRPRAESSLYRASASLCGLAAVDFPRLADLGYRQSDDNRFPSCFPSKHRPRTGNTHLSGTFVLCAWIAREATIRLSDRAGTATSPPSRGTVARLFRFSIAPSSRSYATAFLISWGRSSGPGLGSIRANFALKLSEKSWRYPKRGPTRRPNHPIRPVLAPIHGPNIRLERHANPFSDSFLTEF